MTNTELCIEPYIIDFYILLISVISHYIVIQCTLCRYISSVITIIVYQWNLNLHFGTTNFVHYTKVSITQRVQGSHAYVFHELARYVVSLLFFAVAVSIWHKNVSKSSKNII